MTEQHRFKHAPMADQAPLLHHDRDRLSERRAAYRHAYEVIATDAIARFKRLDGYDVFFLTGTDEHGIKMVQTAAKDGHHAASSWSTGTSQRFQAMAERLNCSNDQFIRTTEPRHHKSSQAIWERDADERRHLPVEICRLVLGARRGLLRRERDAARSSTACASGRRARRSSGSRRRAISSSSPPIRTSCSSSTPTCRTSCCRASG